MERLQVALTAPHGQLAAPGAPFKLRKEKIPAPSDTDGSTRLTVEKMSEYRKQAFSDPVVRQWAEQAIAGYGLNGTDDKAKCWAVFWFVKHHVAFAIDEPRLFEVGEPGGLDLLIAPAVLVRMESPKEDCDGFTMLVCSMLDILGVENYIVTVAADPHDPKRWSHVFAMAKLKDGQLVAMDASHGSHPGWMVPREHIFRYQAWNRSGEPVDIGFPKSNGLHGYIPTGRPGLRIVRRGMGQDSCIVDPETGVCDTPLTSLPGLPTVTIPTITSIDTSFQNWVNSLSAPQVPGSDLSSSVGASTSSASSSSGGTPTNWTSIINALTSGASKVLGYATLPPGYVMGANGQPVYTGQAVASAQLTSSLASWLPILGIGIIAVLLIGSLEGGRR